MNNRPVAILAIKINKPTSARLCSVVEATTRNFRGQETAWMIQVGSDRIQGAFRCSGSAMPREEHVDRIPGNLADMARTLAGAA